METNISKYVALVKTVEYGSFTKAAEILNYTQSGVSKMVRELETGLGITLLERKRSNIELTSEGRQLFPEIVSLCNQYQRIINCVDNLSEIKSGTIRIGTISSTATHWLPNIVRVFQQDFPGIDFEFLLGYYDEIEKWIIDGRVDCGFLRKPFGTDLDTIEMKKDKLLAVLPKDHALSHLKYIPLAALCEEPFILDEREEKAEISEVFERNGLKPKTYVATCDDHAVMSMVEQGLGVSILPELILKRIPYDLTIKELDVPAYRTLIFAVRDKKRAPAAVRKFIDYLDYRECI